jgi:hypothetical protein
MNILHGAAFAAASLVLLLVACSSSTSNGDGSGSGSDTHASVLDAGLDAAALPPGVQACASCFETSCAPETAACVADVTCKEVLPCALLSGCLAPGATSQTISACVATCNATVDAGLTKQQSATDTALLLAISHSCNACIAGCAALLDAGRAD